MRARTFLIEILGLKWAFFVLKIIYSKSLPNAWFLGGISAIQASIFRLCRSLKRAPGDRAEIG
jgi:hypothetical protein